MAILTHLLLLTAFSAWGVLAQTQAGDMTLFSPGLGAYGATNSADDPIVALSAQHFGGGLPGVGLGIGLRGTSASLGL
jgi:hypothetical protein